MTREFGKVTRISVLVTVLIALVMIATPVLQIGGKSVGPVGNAAAANGSRILNVGVIDLQGSVSTLNPFAYTMSGEYDIMWPCYSTMLTYDVNAHLTGDLATDWHSSPDGLTWEFHLARNAYWIDPANPTSTAHPVTATDVMWTYNEIATDAKNHLSSYFLTGTVSIIQSMHIGVDNWDLYVVLTHTYAPFLGALNAIPIVPEYIWGHLTGGKTPTSYSNVPVIGSGPFYCTVNALPLSGVAILKRNPLWFQEANRGWQVHIDTLQYKSESTTANAWIDLTSTPPLLDVYMNVAPSQYINNVQGGHTPGVIGWAQSTGFVYEYQLNQLSTAERAALGMHSGSNSQLLLDPTVKLAMAMCVDKQSFIDQVVLGLGSVADSLVPDCNPWHYTYPNPVQYNPAAARAMLMAAGWAYDGTGAPAGASQTPLYQAGGVNPLQFRMLTLTTDPAWTLGSGLLSQWAALGGVELDVEAVSTNQANSAWYAGDYDTWLWDWVFSPTSDPSTDCTQVDTTMAIGTWSGSYWHNASFDALYNKSLTIMDPVARRVVTDQLQASIYEDHNDQLIAYTKYLYAASTVNWYGPSYGDWAAHWTLMPDSGYPWLYLQLAPVDNHAPTVTAGAGEFDGYLNSPISVFGSAVDDSGGAASMKYQWYWGDGTTSGWQSSGSQSHTYAKDGVYTAYFAAQEQTTADGFMSSAKTTIKVVNQTNGPPTISSVTMIPTSGIKEGTNVSFTCVATDPNSDPLTYSWSFGDTYTGTGATASHIFLTAGTYTVTVSVDDGHPGSGRPAIGTIVVPVAHYYPPVISIISSQAVLWKQIAWFNATASDAAGEPLRFTWVWGDGGKSVTTTPKNVTHTYMSKGTDSLNVFADDLSGVPGHNVSALCQVTVSAGHSIPYGLTLAVNRTSLLAGQSVTFTATAQDPAGDGLRFSINCGDGMYVNVDKPSTANNAVVTATASHIYLSGGSFTGRLYVTDGLDNVTGSGTVVITVTVQHPPVVTPVVAKTGWAGTSVAFSVTATDQDGDTLRYTWNFGDGTWLVGPTNPTHTYAKAGIYTYTVYVNDQMPIAGHNVSSSATASIAFNLPLVVGWNFVSIPVVGFGYKASTLGLATGDVISSWNPATQSYDHTYIKGISPASANFTIAPNVGYWVWVAAAKTLHLTGSVPTTAQSYTFNVPLAGGWVALGLESLKTTLKASNITSMYSGSGAVTVVANYNSVTQKYTSWVSAVPALNNFVLTPGVAYWVWITAGFGGTFTYIP